MGESKHKSSKREDMVKNDGELKRGHREKDRNGERRRERERDRERSVDEKYKDKEKHRERHRDKDKERERERLKEKENREREREKEREKEREREERDRREKREREERDREKMREKRREAERDLNNGHGTDDLKDRDRKKRRRDDDHKEDRERSSKSSGRRKEDSLYNNGVKKIDENLSDKKEGRTREEDMEEEQRKLDDEMEKRRRRVQEWQEKRRKKEESESGQIGETAGKTWTLEGESDDEETETAPVENAEDEMDVDKQNKENGNDIVNGLDNGVIEPVLQNGGDVEEEDEIDPLDAFMNSMVIPEVNKLNAIEPSVLDEKKSDLKKSKGKSMGRIIPGEDSDPEYPGFEDDEDPIEDEDDDEFMKRVKKTKVEKLSLVDHSKINYLEFRKEFYIEVKEIKKMTHEEVAAYRKELELKIHGKDVPKPIKTWHQTGLSTKILDTIEKLNYDKPMPIQTQALPVIMSGRDCIGVAKTGSGKTLAFVLPMLRHIMAQPELEPGDGPIGLVMAPTRELVQQIHSDIRKFTKVLGIHCVPVYGGSGVAQQISELKRGAEIVVCTPGRMIDILCTSAGKITNLRRVSYLVMDEADRMFDMGFEPQITRIVQNTQPKRQTVLFSATFPRQVEVLARKVVINRPVEIQVGGRSVVNKDITQLVEVRPENERFFRLLELLGEWYEKGKVLIFVQSQEKCDSLFRDLLKHGYPCLSLHGAKDQTDRESTISDFKSNVCNLLVATSIAARGLDVKELELVVNYDVPNHYEDYVHRVGRTGRAGRKGCAVTFLSKEDERYAPDLVKALELSNQVVPDDLKSLADAFNLKVNQGLVQAHGTGYGGSGFKFNEEEDDARKAVKKAQAKEYGFEEDKSDSDDDESVKKTSGDLSQQVVLAQAAASQQAAGGGGPAALPAGEAAARAIAMAAVYNLQNTFARIQADSLPEHYEAELEINDFPQNARWKVTHKETLGPISDWTGASITTRGQYVQPGKIPGPGERKLYLFIEGSSEISVRRAKTELKRVLEDITTQALSLPTAQPGRYSVV